LLELQNDNFSFPILKVANPTLLDDNNFMEGFISGTFKIENNENMQ